MIFDTLRNMTFVHPTILLLQWILVLKLGLSNIFTSDLEE